MLNINLKCPKCEGTNINPTGIYHQCQSKRGAIKVKSCGYIADISKFRPTLTDYKE